MTDCYACRLTSGDEKLLGGRVLATDHWVVEHCMGPLGSPMFHENTPLDADEVAAFCERARAAL